VHRSSECSTKVGGAGSDVAEVVIVGKLGYLLDFGGGCGESPEYCQDVGTFLHRDDSELVFFVDPYQECFLIVMEYAST